MRHTRGYADNSYVLTEDDRMMVLNPGSTLDDVRAAEAAFFTPDPPPTDLVEAAPVRSWPAWFIRLRQAFTPT